MLDNCSIFGKPIAIKKYDCNHGEYPGGPIPMSVNLFVKVTNACNAHCLFCSNSGSNGYDKFNIVKLFDVISEIQRMGIIINRLNITGGEPAAVPQLVEHILDLLESKPYTDIHVHLNTNGLLPSSQSLMKHPRWDSVSVSLHHYSISRLSELYGISIPTNALNFENIDMLKVNASCNLVRGYIDTTEEAHKMMDFCLDEGLTRLGFVGLMKVNDYCIEHFVSCDELQLEDISHCYFMESKNRGADCKCSNYQYNRHLKVLDIYMRHYANYNYCESSLVYDGEFLRQGFGTNNIIY